MNPLKDEPVITAIVAMILAAGGMLAAFGLHLSDVQIAAVSQFVQDVLIVGFIVRSQVTPKSHQPQPPLVAPMPVPPTSPVTADRHNIQG